MNRIVYDNELLAIPLRMFINDMTISVPGK